MTELTIDSEKRLVIRYNLDTCENCGALMLPMYEDAHYLPQQLKDKVRSLGIHEEHYRKWDICDVCIKQGGYPETCEICNTEYSFPSEFSFELQYYPKYADDDTRYVYICKQCCMTRAQLTINELLMADDIKDLR